MEKKHAASSPHTMSRRDFLGRAALFAGGAAAASVAATGAAAGAAYADERIGSWSADGAHEVTTPASDATNASAADGTYREHNAAAFPANDASPIPPRDVPAVWDYECDICVVGAGGGGLNAAARAAELGAHTICVEALGMHGGNAQEAGMCGILGGMSLQEGKQFAFPSYPFNAQAL
ncbi:MAG: FAD-binding protein, partial [Eggerthellaceae bacterium]|nr:FAD-binding protein [Eggerthellaceae bacterium]